MANGVIVPSKKVVYSQGVNDLGVNVAWGNMYIGSVTIALPFNAKGRHISASFVPEGSYAAICMIDTVSVSSVIVDLVRPNVAYVSGTVYVEIE